VALLGGNQTMAGGYLMHGSHGDYLSGVTLSHHTPLDGVVFIWPNWLP
jgi:hypothetical protein